MTLYDRIAQLPLTIESTAFEGLAKEVMPATDASPGWTRRTTLVYLRGKGMEGIGEDVPWDSECHDWIQEGGTELPLAGEWTVDSFAQHLRELDLFGGSPPDREVYENYRQWAFESAALDLALRQNDLSLADALQLPLNPVRFVASPGVGHPPAIESITARLKTYPWLEFKLDFSSDWDAEFITALRETGSVATVDFKGAYKGTTVETPADAEGYARVAEILTDATLEDPDLTDPAADAALKPYRGRVAWDAPIHSVQEMEELPFPVKYMNIKPSRFGSIKELFAAYEYCDRKGIAMYGGGQSELGPGRGQIQYLAGLFHPDGPNDTAPRGYDSVEFPASGLDSSPLEPSSFDPTGFRRSP